MTTKDNKEKLKVARETLGKLFYRMAEIVFAGVVVVNIPALRDGNIDKLTTWGILIFGIIIMTIFVSIGDKILKH